MRGLTILAFMGAIAFVAVGLKVVRDDDELWTATFFAMTLAALCAAVLVALYRRGAGAGFALFGWAAFLFCQPQAPPATGPTSLPLGAVCRLLSRASANAFVQPNEPEGPGFSTIAADPEGRPILYYVSNTSVTHIGRVPVNSLRAAQCVVSVVFGFIGAVVGAVVERRLGARRDSPQGDHSV
jgi:hypothetical protein